MPLSKTQRSRYTPPAPKKLGPSKPWVAVTMFTMLVVGVVIIVLNYLEILPGGTDNANLLLGLAYVTGGFVFATQLR